MRSLHLGLKGILPAAAVVTVGLLGVTQQAAAVSINTPASVCNMYGNRSPTEIVYSDVGVSNATDSFKYIMCAVPRSPLSATTGGFYVDGENSNGASTTCTASSYDYNGTFKAAKSFTSSAARYGNFLAFTNAELPPGAYVSLVCKLPASNSGLLRGITAIQ